MKLPLVLLLLGCTSAWKFHALPQRSESASAKSLLSSELAPTTIFTAEQHVATTLENLKLRLRAALHEVMLSVVVVLLAPCVFFLIARHLPSTSTKEEELEETGQKSPARKHSVLRDLGDQVPEALEGPLGTWLAERLPEGITFQSALPTGPQIALSSAGRETCSYDELRVLFQTTDVAFELGLGPMPRVGLCMQNGPHMAAALVVMMQQACCIPLDPNCKEEELAHDLEFLQVEALVVDAVPLAAAAERMGIPWALLVPQASSAGTFSLQSHIPCSGAVVQRVAPCLTDTCLVLCTSGTTGRRKSVPCSMLNLLSGAACVIKSWDLQDSDVCLNMMPLNHVGGIVRNLLGTLFSGGRLVCMSSFDPEQFWECVGSHGITWYYASPTIHREVLKASRKGISSAVKMRMVCNAAGGLPPALAQELRECFHCSVLPSYGMTECMPISSPPTGFAELAPTTSGLPCGPEVAIMDESGTLLGPGQEGQIVLRGAPLMAGYEQGEANESCYREGWFDTGDRGFLSDLGWLQVTGRTKEVIKRGGETLSPAEVEAAITASGLQKQVEDLAVFAIEDVDFGENVALALVSRGACVTLPEIQSALKAKIRPQCWPQAILYASALPRTSTRKVKRGQLTKMCPKISSSLSWRQRSFEELAGAVSRVVPSDVNLRDLLAETFPETLVADVDGARVAYLRSTNPKPLGDIHRQLLKLEPLERPDAIVQVGDLGAQELPKPQPFDFLTSPDWERPANATEALVRKVWAEVLGCQEESLSVTASFFEVGGTSLLAGKLSYSLAKHFAQMPSTASFFAMSTIRDQAAACDKEGISETGSTQTGEGDDTSVSSGSVRTPTASGGLVPATTPRLSSTQPLVLLLQLLPALLYPALYTYVAVLVILGVYSGTAKLHSFGARWLLAIGALGIVRAVLLPCIPVLMKMALLGQVVPGRHPLWGDFYLRWFLVRQARLYFPQGIFNYSSGLRRAYLRALGARVAQGVEIGELGTTFIEGDLLTIAEGTWLDKNVDIQCSFLDGGSSQLCLSAVNVGEDCRVGYGAILVAGTCLDNRAIAPPCSTSYELRPTMRQGFRSAREPGLSYVILGQCTAAAISLISWAPALLLVLGSLHLDLEDRNLLRAYALSMCQVNRICLVLLGAIYLRVCAPIIFLSLAVVSKWLLVGKLRAGPIVSDYQRFQHWFLQILFTKHRMISLTHIVGPHYRVMTWFYRLLGMKVGKRTFWPGTPLEVYDFDLVEIGDDVTFGSRSAIFCADSSEAKVTQILSGAMVADTCVLLPGTVVGKGAVLGTGSLGDGRYPNFSVALGYSEGGAKILRMDNPDAKAKADKPTPFGIALYSNEAVPYRVMGQAEIILANVFTNVLFGPALASLKFIGLFVFLCLCDLELQKISWVRSRTVYSTLFMAALTLICYLRLVLTLLTTVAMKWAIIGRRREGIHNWDTDTYNQRWKLYIAVSSALAGEDMLTLLSGSAWLAWYYRSMGGEIGSNVCIWEDGSGPRMTEPDLFAIGDDACIDNASVVAHMNTLGVFTLQKAKIGRNCTLRRASRIMQGGEMEDGAVLLEKALVLPGERQPSRTVWLGRPRQWQGKA